MVVTEPATARHGSPRRSPTLDRASLLRASLLALRAGPALILLVLIVVVALTTPVFLTSRNIGNVFSQTSVIAVLPARRGRRPGIALVRGGTWSR
jgi:ribose transport system permease protein